jgi:hypothetical protein
MREKEEHEYICGAKTEKCDKCNKYITIKDFDGHHCDEEIYLNKHIDVNNIPVVKKKQRVITSTGQIANMNKVGILHGNKEPIVRPVNTPIIQPPIIHHKRDIVVNKGPSVKVEVGNKDKFGKIEIAKKPNISDKYKKDKVEKKVIDKKDIEIKELDKKELEKKELDKKEIKPKNKIDDILKAGLKHKENIPKHIKPVTPNNHIDLNKKITSSPQKLIRDPIIKKMPYKKEIPKQNIKKDKYYNLIQPR